MAKYICSVKNIQNMPCYENNKKKAIEHNDNMKKMYENEKVLEEIIEYKNTKYIEYKLSRKLGIVKDIFCSIKPSRVHLRKQVESFDGLYDNEQIKIVSIDKSLLEDDIFSKDKSGMYRIITWDIYLPLELLPFESLSIALEFDDMEESVLVKIDHFDTVSKIIDYTFKENQGSLTLPWENNILVINRGCMGWFYI